MSIRNAKTEILIKYNFTLLHVMHNVILVQNLHRPVLYNSFKKLWGTVERTLIWMGNGGRLWGLSKEVELRAKKKGGWGRWEGRKRERERNHGTDQYLEVSSQSTLSVTPGITVILTWVNQEGINQCLWFLTFHENKVLVQVY